MRVNVANYTTGALHPSRGQFYKFYFFFIIGVEPYGIMCAMKTITIERTAKRFKLMSLLASLVLIVTPFWAYVLKCQAEIVGGEANFWPPAITFGVALVAKLVIRFLIWWYHD